MSFAIPIILLCGGESRRMGQPKGLLDYFGRPWILEQMARYFREGGEHVYVVLGGDALQYQSAKIQAQVTYGRKISFVLNTCSQAGSFSSVQVGLRAVSLRYPGVLVQPIDVPLPSRPWLRSLVTSPDVVAMPRYQNKRGHPVYLPQMVWKTLLEVPLTSATARLDEQLRLIAAPTREWLTLEESVLENLNTPTAWQQWIKREALRGNGV